MRVATDTRHLEVEPGDSTSVVVEVVNTDDIIDGVSAHIIGLPDTYVSASPAMLPLFPDTAGKVTLGLAVPTSHPAGRHPLTVQVVSHGTQKPPSYVDIDLDVAARPGMRMTVRPKLVRARRSGRFVLEVANHGNVPLDVTLRAYDPDRGVEVTFTPERRRLEPGVVAPVLVDVRGPRMFTGAEIDRTVVLGASGRAITAAPRLPDHHALAALADDQPTASIPKVTGDQPPESAAEIVLERETTVQLRQRPLISRGLLTVLILVSIVAVWAAIFLLGLGKVFASDPMTKQAPASFFASLNNPDGGSGGGSGGGAGGSGGAGGGGAGGSGGAGGAAPAGALTKSGQLPPGMGGAISGTVTAANDQQPVGRILVQAYRMSSKGLVQMSSAASQADGTYTLAGLFPTDYYIQFSASGYVPQWYPATPTQAGAQPVTAVAQGSTSNINASIVGEPATISGKVDPGDTLTPVITTVTARPLLGKQTGQPVATTKTSGGSYTLPALPAPGSYQLTFTTEGYESSTLVDSVGGGDKRLEPTVVLGASTGQISGLISDGTAPLGGASVSTTVNGSPLTVLTPTTGQVGDYVLANLPTPATYVITVSSPGHGTATRIVDLAAGQSKSALNVPLASGTGTVSGKVIGPDGQPLGGATVTVGGAVNSSGDNPTATTLTSGSPGTFAINRLTAPGSYTLTASMDGYAPASVPVTLADDGAPQSVTIRLFAKLGSIAGTIRSSSGTFAGATITATNGRQSWTTTSNSSDGGYRLADLQPGSYSVTVTAAGKDQQTALVTVVAGRTTKQNLKLGG